MFPCEILQRSPQFVFVRSFCQRDSFCHNFWVIAALEPYYFVPNMLQTLEIKALMIARCMITLKKIDFVNLVKDAKSVAEFSPIPHFRD